MIWLSRYETGGPSSRVVPEILPRCESSECLVGSLSVVVVVEVVEAAIEGFDSVGQLVGAVELVSVGGLKSLDAAVSWGDLGGRTQSSIFRSLQAFSKSAMNSLPPSTWMARTLKGACSIRRSRKRLAEAAVARLAAMPYPPRPLRPRLRVAPPPVEGCPRHAHRDRGLPRRQTLRHRPAPAPHQLDALVDRRLDRLRSAAESGRGACAPANLAGQALYLHGGSPFARLLSKTPAWRSPFVLSTEAAKLWKTLRVSHSRLRRRLHSICLTSV